MRRALAGWLCKQAKGSKAFPSNPTCPPSVQPSLDSHLNRLESTVPSDACPGYYLPKIVRMVACPTKNLMVKRLCLSYLNSLPDTKLNKPTNTLRGQVCVHRHWPKVEEEESEAQTVTLESMQTGRNPEGPSPHLLEHYRESHEKRTR